MAHRLYSVINPSSFFSLTEHLGAFLKIITVSFLNLFCFFSRLIPFGVLNDVWYILKPICTTADTKNRHLKGFETKRK